MVNMVLIILAVCLSWLAILSPIVHSHAIVQLEARGHGNFPDPGHDKLGAVASESAVCSKVGTGLLEKGGNAADAVRVVHKRKIHFHVCSNMSSNSLSVRSSVLESSVSWSSSV